MSDSARRPKAAATATIAATTSQLAAPELIASQVEAEQSADG